ncbi:MAG: restriction endonuclease subunit S [Chloroflexi bacterium]|nr:restriction endonuclease subunit S [Chloroflexota bacterium]
MSGGWPSARLSDLLVKSEEWISLEPDARYREVTVRLWGKGVVLRKEVTGAEIAASRRAVVRTRQLILSRIDARNGAIGLVPDHLDGALVSTDFPTFTVNSSRLVPEFLHWMSKTPSFVAICKFASEGTTNRVRLKEDRFLAMEISLPPLREQQRIVARIEELAAKIEEAKRLRREAADETQVFVTSWAKAQFAPKESSRWRTLSVEGACEAIIDYRGRTPPIASEGIPHLTSANIRNGRIDWNTTKFVSKNTYEAFMTRGIPSPGDVIFTMEAPLGETAVVPDERPFSLAQRTLLLRAAKGVVEGDFLAKVLTSPLVHDTIYAKATGTTVKGIASKRLKGIMLPIPPLPEQRRIVAYLASSQTKVDALKKLQAETAAELDALLPSILDKAFKGEL